MKRFKLLFFLFISVVNLKGQNVIIEPAQNFSPLEKNPEFETNHFSVFHQTELVNGIPVFGIQKHILVKPNGESEIIYQPEGNKWKTIIPFSTIDTAKVFSRFKPRPEVLKISEVYFQNKETLLPALQINYAENSTQNHLLITNLDGEILESYDLIQYAKFSNDSVTKAWVFNPDPLTSSNTTYGDSAIDNNDSSTSFLESQMVHESIHLTYIDSLNKFLPENQFLKLQEFSSPNIPPTPYPNPIPKYTRNQPQFEELNVVFHIENFRKHLKTIGFDSLVNYQIAIDAHGFGGADQSSFNDLFTPPRLTFGIGGVDDAEDADVIIHEYAHAIYFDVNPLAQLGGERAAIEEAFCDYFAASYSKTINPFNWHRVFNWDGHNEFWSGRVVNSPKTYPTGIKNNIYQDAEILSSALMEIWDVLGRNLTDKLLISSAALHLNNMSMQDAAYLFLYVNDIETGGQNREDVCQIFQNRGLINNCPPLGIENSFNKADNLKFWINHHSIMLNQPVLNKANYSIYNLNGQLIQTGYLEIGDNQIQFQQNVNGILVLKIDEVIYKLISLP